MPYTSLVVALFLSFVVGTFPFRVRAVQAIPESGRQSPIRDQSSFESKQARALDTSQQARLEEWNRGLDGVQDVLDNEKNLASRDSELRSRLHAIRRGLLDEREEAIGAKREASDLLRTLEGASDESSALVDRAPLLRGRKQLYTDRIAVAKLYIVQSDLLLARLDALTLRLAKLTRQQMIQSLVKKNPVPLAPRTIAGALYELKSQASRVIHVPIDWYRYMPVQDWRDLAASPLLWVYVVVAGFCGAISYYFLSVKRRLEAELDSKSTSARQRLTTLTLWAQVLFPCGIVLGAQWLVRQSYSMFPRLFLLVFDDLCLFLVGLVIAIFLPPIFLAPTYGESVSNRVRLLGAVHALNTLIFSLIKALMMSEDALAVIMLVMTAVESWLVLSALDSSRWHSRREGALLEGGSKSETEDAERDSRYVFYQRAASRAGLWRPLRLFLLAVLFSSLVAQLAGYGHLGYYVARNVVGSILVLGALTLVRDFAGDWCVVGLGTQFVKKWLGLSGEGESMLLFWVGSFLTLCFLALGAFSLIVLWDLPILQTWLQFLGVFYGFRVGDVTISPRDLLAAFLGSSASLLAFRLARRFLEERIMPRLVVDSGVRYSIIAIFGYSGVVVSSIVGMRILGVGLQTISIMAGALLVGIGFGLRSIAENFISGLVLLFERPIKVGDMVEVGGVQGFVTRIHIRATQVTTFDRSEVVIPNAVLVTTGVTNWTHTSRQARINVAVCVEYGTDVSRVQDVLLKIAGANAQVLRRPTPEVLLVEFGERGLNFELRCFTADAAMRLSVSSQLRYEIERAFEEANIRVALPRRNIKVLSPDRPKDAREGGEVG